MTLSGHLGYRDGLLKQYTRYALNFQGYAMIKKRQLVVEEGNEGLTAAELFYSLAA